MNRKDDKNLKDEELKKDDSHTGSDSLKDSDSGNKDEKEPFAYTDDEFNPDQWNEKDDKEARHSRRIQQSLTISASIIALVLFAALFIVEFRSMTKVKKTETPVTVNQDSKEEKKQEPIDKTIMEILETGSNYSIYLDTETGVEYIMFKVGSSISIQPLINADGSYKRYVEPTLAPASSTEQTTAARIGWFNKNAKTTESPSTSVAVTASSEAASTVPSASATGETGQAELPTMPASEMVQ